MDINTDINILDHVDSYYTDNNSLYIGTQSRWYKSYINNKRDIHEYVRNILWLLIDKYIIYLELITFPNHNLNGTLKILEPGFKILCDCHMVPLDDGYYIKKNPLSVDEIISSNNLKDPSNVCHGEIISDIISVIKKLDSLYRDILTPLSREKKKKKIKSLLLLGSKDDDPLVIVGSIINNRYKITKDLSKGSSGHIVMGTDILDGTKNIIKISRSTEKSMMQIEEEYNKIKSIHSHSPDHRGLTLPEVYGITSINSYSWNTCSKYNIVVMKRYGKDLYDSILMNKKFKRKGIGLESVRYIGRQLINTFKILHEKEKIIHKDLKPDNILLRNVEHNHSKDKYDVVVVDFGLSCVLKEGMDRKNYRGTRSYMSPEELTGHGWGKEADIWTIGITLYELYYGCNMMEHDNEINLIIMTRLFPDLYDGVNHNIINRARFANKEREYKNNDIYDDKGVPFNRSYFINTIPDARFRHFVTRCLDPCKETRITLDEMLKHSFIDPRF